MLHINVVCVGKIKESFFRDAISEYSKRLSRFCNLNIVELADEKIPDNASDSVALDTPPVIKVIIPAILIAIIAPKYGIILNKPIVNPSNVAYFIPKIFIVTVAKMPTTSASINWLDINLKNTPFEL